VHTDDLKPVNK